VAVANHLMASAAYWIGSAAEEVVVTPSGDVGSVGVFAMHEDWSGALEKEGINISLISAGKYKVEGNPYQPLGEEARAAIQASVDEVYDVFTNAVARNRGVNPAAVRTGFGEGRVVGAQEALKLGMVDRIDTLEGTINRLLGKSVPAASMAAVADAEHSEVAQEPSSDTKPHLEEARARLAQVGQNYPEGETPMLRNLINQHAELVARAQKIVDTADAESRDLTEDERADFNTCLEKAEELDKQISRIQDERERLRNAAERKFLDNKAEKPGDSPDKPKTMKLAEFNALDPKERLAFVKAGGKVTD
jgi:ClpP class serine protease